MDSEIIEEKKLIYHIDLPNEKMGEDTKNGNSVNIINKKSFSNSNLEEYKCERLERIEKQAFANCKLLKYFIEEENENKNKNDTSPKNNSLIIDEESFLNCSELRTVVFSDGEKLIIGKDVFKGCYSLRTVKADFMNAYICGNPFEDCPEYLTFVCKKNSDIERFAIEHGYEVVYENGNRV